MSAGLSRPVRLLLRIGVSAALISWFLFRYDFGELPGVFASLPLSLWLAGCAMYLAAQVLSSVRWWILARSLGFEGHWRYYLKLYFIGMFFNLFFPTSLGGDVFKVHWISRENKERMRAAFTVLGDRFSGLIAMLFLGIVAIGTGFQVLPRKVVTALALVGGCVVLGALGFPLIYRLARRAWPQLAGRLSPVTALRDRRRTVSAVMGLSLILQTLGLGVVAVLGTGLGIAVPLTFYFVAVPLIVFLTLLPVSFSGIGIREGAFVFFFGLQGVRPEVAFSLGLLSFSVQVCVSLIGGLLYAAGVHR